MSIKALIEAHIRKLWLKDIQKDIQFVQKFQGILDFIKSGSHLPKKKFYLLRQSPSKMS